MRRCAVLAVLAASATASADPPKLVTTLTAEINLASGSAGKPTSVAPDVSYLATPDLTVAVITSTFGTTGFRGSAGDGLCITGNNKGCPHLFNNAGAEGAYALSKGAGAIAGVLGLYTLNLDAHFADVKVGARVKLTEGTVSLSFTPSVYIGLNDRHAMVPNGDILYVPVGLSVEVDPVLRVGVGSGIKGPLGNFAEFGQKWTVPIGVNAQYAWSPEVAIGAAFTFGKIVGASGVTPVGSDFRVLQLWLAWTP